VLCPESLRRAFHASFGLRSKFGSLVMFACNAKCLVDREDFSRVGAGFRITRVDLDERLPSRVLHDVAAGILLDGPGGGKRRGISSRAPPRRDAPFSMGGQRGGSSALIEKGGPLPRSHSIIFDHN
jgi:hypothetical protein